MITRVWHGLVPREKADAYYELLLASGLADYRATTGNRGVFTLRRFDGELAHFVLVSFWQDVDAIRAFAGADHERARYYPTDAAFLVEREPFVTHYELRIEPPAHWPGALARVWRGYTRPAQAQRYEELLRHEIFTEIAGREIPGFRGICLQRRESTDATEFVTVMGFDSLDAVRAFAGADVEASVVPAAARALLHRFDERSRHYDVLPGA